jgi:nucleoside-diphosphate-sugar epimerase
VSVRVVVTGATGNIGTSVLRSLQAQPEVERIDGIARRLPELTLDRVRWQRADVAADDLEPLLSGADAVVHLAWLIQPSRDREQTRRTNVEGSRRVFEAVARCEVPRLVYASSVGAYSPGSKELPVDESHPTGGIESSFYSRDKSEVERLLDGFESAHPEVAVARIRPALVFKREAASEIRRLFAGPFLPSALLSRRLLRFVPRIPGLRFQVVHSLDVGDAFATAATQAASGAFNLAADPVLDPEEIGRLLEARPLPVPARAARTAASLSWRLRLQPSPPGWLDLALGVPVMSTRRARRELGWEPRAGAGETLLQLIDGLRCGAGFPTPPLDPDAGGPLRLGELRTGVGAVGVAR